MSAFIVSGGALIEIGCPSTLNRETGQLAGFDTTIGGRRFGFIRKGGRRSWSISVSTARPGEVSTLEAVARRLGPYGWYGPESVIGNLLSPQASSWAVPAAGETRAGLVQLPDGTVAESLASSARVRIGNAHGNFEMAPVRPGHLVTVSAWGFGGLRLQGFWRDGTGASISSFIASPIHTFAGWEWREHTIAPPLGAAFVELNLTNGTAYALPSIAWGTKGRPELGTGCPKAVIHSPAFSPIALWEGANYTGANYTVTEIGRGT